MKTRKNSRRLLTGLAATTLVVAACGSDVDDSLSDEPIDVPVADDGAEVDPADGAVDDGAVDDGAVDDGGIEDDGDAMEDDDGAMEDDDGAVEDDDAMEDDAMEDDDGAVEDDGAGIEDGGTVLDVASETSGFTTLTAAISAAGLDAAFSQEGPLTVFAPTDDAFAALPEGVLDALLLPENQAVLGQVLAYHVVSSEIPSSAVVPGPVLTAQGEEVEIATDGESVTIAEATILQTDVEATNGVIHVIDSVLIPPSVDPAALLEGGAETGDADDGTGDADSGEGDDEADI